MPERRKDNKGRVLKTGESQRKDLIYQYRYMDIHGKRKTIYSSDLQELHKKEKEVQRSLDDRLDYAEGSISMIELLERYLDTKQNFRRSTKNNHEKALKIIRESTFCHRHIRDVRMSDIKRWLMELLAEGRKFSTLKLLRSVLRPAFQMAVDEDVISRNPFDFMLQDILKVKHKERVYLTDEQQLLWLEFMRTDKYYKKYYDICVVLLGTGIRAGELCGLTVRDIDFERNRISVNHQICYSKETKRYVEETKSEAGTRFIPMSAEVAQSIRNLIRDSELLDKQVVIDGYTGFFILDSDGLPRHSGQISSIFIRAYARYNKIHPDSKMPNIAAHAFRRTFCTNLANQKLNMKAIQYLAGHSGVKMTFDVYVQSNYDVVEKQFNELLRVNSDNFSE